MKEVSLAMIIPAHTDDSEDDKSLSVTSERASTVHEGSNANDPYRNRDKEAQIEIARKEERTVKIIRVVTFTAILLCAVAVSASVYYFATASDQYNFELEVSKHGELSHWTEGFLLYVGPAIFVVRFQLRNVRNSFAVFLFCALSTTPVLSKFSFTSGIP